MKINVATLFPEVYNALNSGIIGKALEEKLFEVNVVNIRDFTLDKHKHCDDYSFGGGAGMIMTPQPLCDTIEHLDKYHKATRIYMSPKGKPLSQQDVERLSKLDELVLVSGSYEGIDERVIDSEIDEEISIGDYVLTSGDLPCMVLINAIARYIPGVLGNEETTSEESFVSGLLEYPQYTRPSEYKGMKVPDVLLSGNHQEIAKWRLNKQLEITKKVRPDLYQKYLEKKEI